MISHIAGIQPVESTPGYKRIHIAPVIGGTLTYAQGHFISPYGRISSSWKYDGNSAVFDIEIPTNTTAEIALPAALINADKIREQYGGNIAGDVVTFTVGSGSYSFR